METKSSLTAAQVDVIRANALMAIDQRRDKNYSSMDEVLCAYFDNVLDTLTGLSVAARADAFVAYRSFAQAEAKRLRISLKGTSCGKEVK